MRIASALLVTALLAGCSGSSSTTSPSTTATTSSATAVAGLAAPVLHVGDWWNFTAPGGAWSYVVSAETATDYIFDTDSPGLAFFNALQDVSTLGAIRKTDLAGSQGSARVEFVHWPLVDGKNWTMTLDGVALKVTAKQSGPQTFAMTALTQNGTAYVTYTYDNRTRWFTDIDFKDETGASAFAIKLQASGTAFPGRLLRYSLASIAKDTPPPGPQVGYNSNFNVPAGATDVYLQYSTQCNPGAYVLSMGPTSQDAQSQGTLADGPCDGAHTKVIPVSPAGGSWGIGLDCTAPTNCGLSYNLMVRTLTVFQAGKAPA